MAEGNPDNSTDLTTKGDKIVFMPDELLAKYQLKDATNPVTKLNS